MDILLYNDFEYHQLKDKVQKTLSFLKEGDFRAADVKKMPNQGYYRAKLDDTNRLLFTIGSYQGRKYVFVLEVILNHNYSRCRFLNGVKVDENRLQPVYAEQETEGHEVEVSYVNTSKKKFHILDKLLSFDDAQDTIIDLPAPIIVIGPAGSGKTALMLEKIKALSGNILYVSLSPYLVENAQNLYAAYGYDNPKQTVEFLSFNDFLDTVEVAEGKELTFRVFNEWASRYKQSYKIKDTHKLYEEFKGVLTGSAIDKAHLSAEDYLGLGIRQSIFQQQDRPAVHELFMKYLHWLEQGGYFDSNIRSFHLLERISPLYDYVVVDEVQDITNVQLYAILKSLNEPVNFLLCGDSNQIVHPNFFSWSQVKTLFYHQDLSAQIIRVLATNYRNTPEVTAIANRLLLIKNARFGSIDKESTYLVQANSAFQGIVELLPNTPKVSADLNSKTKQSAKFAVLVLREEDKAAARKFFQTPLLFSIHEAKGLEYENIVLFNMISGHDKTFHEITDGVTAADLQSAAIHFARARDKTNRSLDEFKFYINALYVGMTRAIKNLFLVESNSKHELLKLLDLIDVRQQTSLKNQASSKSEWQKEARKLEMQGKQEQADAIREQILQIKPIEWEVITPETYGKLLEQALHPDHFNKKAKDRLFQYAVYYRLAEPLRQLSALKYRPADRWEQGEKTLLKRLFQPYLADNLKAVQPIFQRYGVDFRDEFNLTPLLISARFNAANIMDHLLKQGAKVDTTDNDGINPLRWLLRNRRQGEHGPVDLLGRHYASLKTAPLRIRVEKRLVKLESHQAEYLMLNFMLASLKEQLILGTQYGPWRANNPRPAFQAQDFIDFYEGLGEQVVPEYRTQRPYISSILAKNEIGRDDPHDRQLFVRAQHGYYLPHPNMELPVGNGWKNIYDLVGLDEIKNMEHRFNTGFLNVIERFRKYWEENPDARVKHTIRIK
ncbi:UvrD-helicase domain-containing protein [Parapedobacter tibetensis]|uniref:UvrD-helicase domain-containing protein n=1 Tax=Parapedobacter tibetensis TaxID=2972951 RepID=UPI00214D6049|nr:UvrD-helicase domain-containing protein [Parapedobacter tibetensis]